MKSGGHALLDVWLNGGPFIGSNAKANAYVTVQPDWYLNTSSGAVGNHRLATDKQPGGPIRWWQKMQNNQTEIPIPGIKTISIDRGIDDVAASATISLYNQKMDPNTSGSLAELGSPGYLTPTRGTSSEANARWGQTVNEWSNLLTPEACLRTYEGYGGHGKPLASALRDGNVTLTGVWLIDTVTVGTDGMMSISARDVGKLLVEQFSYPPLVPREFYPVDFRRWTHDIGTTTTTTSSGQPGIGDVPMAYGNSGNVAWVGPEAAAAEGQKALDQNFDTYWKSIGNQTNTAPNAFEFIEFNLNEQLVDSVYVSPRLGNYHVYISVDQGGAWAGSAVIPYEPSSNGRYSTARGYPDQEAHIPYVAEFNVPWNGEIVYPIGTYTARKVRFTFTNLAKDGGSYYAEAKELRVRFNGNQTTSSETTSFDIVGQGNYTYYEDIVKHYLLWAGWWLYDELNPNSDPVVFGIIDPSGVPGTDRGDDYIVPPDFFDKRSVADVINEFKEILGYVFYTDDDGAVIFNSPNWWGPGNYIDRTHKTASMYELDERHLLTDYTASFNGASLRSEIIISTSDPETEVGGADTVTTSFKPPTAALLRGQIRPSMWVNGKFTNKAEQEELAKLIAVHIWFQQRMGSVTIIANPLIQVDDQVRIFERVTAESYIHYVRRISSELDLDSGVYTMTLTTNWLGTEDEWSLT